MQVGREKKVKSVNRRNPLQNKQRRGWKKTYIKKGGGKGEGKSGRTSPKKIKIHQDKGTSGAREEEGKKQSLKKT